MNEATIAKKQEEVDQLVEELKQAGSTVFVDYLGLTVAEITNLRVRLHKENCRMRVIKNNILKRATEKIGFVKLHDAFVGPSAAVFSQDEVTASKIVYGFVKENDRLNVKAGIVDNQVLTANELKQISNLPNKNGMISMLLSVLQAPVRGLACALKAVADAK
ncbi:MAG: 50S ribosomal protein L10 [Bacilli bacterium]|jgi:large subunit ribosomal protein L10|nr:50S ribosomal protein L10 [Bacilli bacterium]HHU24640.1 50S ribosomal protein L10 [Acholeplasmataceae bacterium]